MHADPDQRAGNPDVNSFVVDQNPSEDQTDRPDDPVEDQDRGSESGHDSAPLPPDVPQPFPVEEPSSDKPPIGDVNDSPKQIVR
ncbi:MAG: hypothetical protein ABI539_06090 [Acidobacteriota bacterium]